MADILIVGAGPVGLTLACELARHGTRCRIVDRLVQPLPFCRAIGVTPRTLEVWENMGVAHRMIDAGLWIEGFRSIVNDGPAQDERVDFPDLPYSHLGLPQYEKERVLAEQLAQFGIAVERGVELTELAQDDTGVTVHLQPTGGDAASATFRYVVGCDGAHSAVRHALGIAFEGDAFPMRFGLGDVHISWDLPHGMALRALRFHAGRAPELLVAIPLPEHGRYRVTTLAPPGPAGGGGTEHGIQSEARGPSLDELQAVVGGLVPGEPPVTDLRWSSVFRISMRLAAHYRQGCVFIAGDAAHIHPPTGGQGMNTGIQDTYNLAWKLAAVLAGGAPAALLDSYESERRPVGADVVARTRAATENFGREGGAKPDRLADTQILVSYRGGDWVRDDMADADAAMPAAGDRAPDAGGLRRNGVGFPLRLFDVLRGTEHVLVAHVDEGVADFADFARQMRARFGARVRFVAITAADGGADEPGVAFFHDREGGFAAAYGGRAASFLVRPDGHVGWRGWSWRDAGLLAHLGRVLEPDSTAAHP
jgi:2-polyprenyl-6-methoxyphenol hydroxylase-like FAD-dependent oxidoreductase